MPCSVEWSCGQRWAGLVFPVHSRAFLLLGPGQERGQRRGAASLGWREREGRGEEGETQKEGGYEGNHMVSVPQGVTLLGTVD